MSSSTDRIEVVYARRAAAEIEAANTWWRANRLDAADAIVEELQRAIALLVLQPKAGAHANLGARGEVRRVLLPRVGYFLYYRYRPRLRRLDILALWHARRQTGPGV